MTGDRVSVYLLRQKLLSNATVCSLCHSFWSNRSPSRRWNVITRRPLASLLTMASLTDTFSPCLSPRDLSENALQAVPRKAFRGATDLKNL